jgi:hypothetical protein
MWNFTTPFLHIFSIVEGKYKTKVKLAKVKYLTFKYLFNKVKLECTSRQKFVDIEVKI